MCFGLKLVNFGIDVKLLRSGPGRADGGHKINIFFSVRSGPGANDNGSLRHVQALGARNRTPRYLHVACSWEALLTQNAVAGFTFVPQVYTTGNRDRWHGWIFRCWRKLSMYLWSEWGSVEYVCNSIWKWFHLHDALNRPTATNTWWRRLVASSEQLSGVGNKLFWKMINISNKHPEVDVWETRKWHGNSKDLGQVVIDQNVNNVYGSITQQPLGLGLLKFLCHFRNFPRQFFSGCLYFLFFRGYTFFSTNLWSKFSQCYCIVTRECHILRESLWRELSKNSYIILIWLPWQRHYPSDWLNTGTDVTILRNIVC